MYWENISIRANVLQYNKYNKIESLTADLVKYGNQMVKNSLHIKVCP